MVLWFGRCDRDDVVQPVERFVDEIEVDPTQPIRDHLETLPHRHPEVFEKELRKLETDREF